MEVGADKTVAQVPSRSERLLLRVVQAGAIAIVLVVVPFESFDLDRFFVPKELVLHLTACIAALCMLGDVRRYRLGWVDFVIVGFLAVSALSAVFASNLWNATRALTMSISGFTLFWGARTLAAAGLSPRLLGALAFSIVLATATSLLQAYGVETVFFSEDRVPGGTLGNRNFVAHLAAFGLPLVLLVTLRTKRFLVFLLGAVGTLLVVSALILTRSRAGWLGFAAALSVLLLGTFFTPAVRRSGRFFFRLVLVLLFAGGGVAAALLTPNDLNWSSDSPYLETARGVVNYREGSGRGRLIQYENSLQMVRDNPVLGVGPGNWTVEYPAYATRGDPSLTRRVAGMTANPWPSSDWVAVITERGLAGFVLLLLICGGIVWNAWKNMRTAEDADEGLASLVLPAILIGVSVSGAFDAVTLLAWPTYIFWAAAGALWPRIEPSGAANGSFVRKAALFVLILVAGLAGLRSVGQLTAMGLYDRATGPRALEVAAFFDPGNYRVHVRLAQMYRNDREQRCEHATRAHRLFPHAAEAEQLARRCR